MYIKAEYTHIISPCLGL